MSVMKEKKIEILLIEDNPGDVRIVEESIAGEGSEGYELTSVNQLSKLTPSLMKKSFDVILVDLALPDSEGIDTVKKVHKLFPRTPMVVLTGAMNDKLGIESVRMGAQNYLMKGRVDGKMLLMTMSHAMERERMQNEIQIANEKLETLASLDPLTELLNRRGFERVLIREIAWAKRNATELQMILIDLDDFKGINDTYGHDIGDTVLREIGLRLRQILRTTDYVSRIGGDEFIILLPQTKFEEGVNISERVRDIISKVPIITESRPIKVTASLGLMTVPKDIKDIDMLLKKTHPLLKESKLLGKNQVTYNDRGSRIQQQGGSLSPVMESLQKGDYFKVLKQPIFDLIRKKIVGYEFLTRLNIEGFELPEHFFPVSMRAGLLNLVDQHCFKACVEASKKVPSGIRCHINLFPSTLLSAAGQALVEEIRGVKDKAYCIEISEQRIVGK